jgi:hypothetical protein
MTAYLQGGEPSSTLKLVEVWTLSRACANILLSPAQNVEPFFTWTCKQKLQLS